jgi:arylsulfatase A-like enzyme
VATTNNIEMKNSKILNYSSTVIGFFTCSSVLYAQNNMPERPNVVIILADDMGYGDVSSNNPFARTSTPAIDKLAKEGIRFTDAHSGGAVCTPSRYSLLTGRYFFRVPKQPAYWGYLAPLIEPERETIGTLMQNAGYSTACIGKWHLGLNWGRKDESKPQIQNKKVLGYTNTDYSKPVVGGPNELGFDYSYILPASLDMPPYTFVRNGKVVDPNIVLTADIYPHQLDRTTYAWDRKHTNENDIYWDRGVWWRNGEMSKSFKVENCLDDIVDEGISYIEREGKNKKPFLLYLPLTGPHTPWMPNSKFKGASELGTYGDFIAQIDNVVSKVTDKLEELGIDKNTIVIFSSDNGGAWEEDDIQQYAHQSNWSRRGQKGDIWDGGHHIPLIVKWPARIKQEGSYSETVGLVDVFATLADLTGQHLTNNQAEDSFSFMNVINGDLQSLTRDHIIYLSSAGKLAIKKGPWKYVDCIGSGGFTNPSVLLTVKNGPTGQLYNLADDPLESNNLVLRKRDIVKDLSELLNVLVNRGYSKK